MLYVKKPVFVLAVASLAAFLLFACDKPGGGPSPNQDAKTAAGAVSRGYSYAPPVNTVTYDSLVPHTPPFSYASGLVPGPNGGSLTVSYTTDTELPYSFAFNMTCTCTFSNWYDSPTGYTINGTFTDFATSNVGMSSWPNGNCTVSDNMTGDLTLSGGPVSTYSMDYTVTTSVDASMKGTYTFAGTVTVNGKVIDINSLVYGRLAGSLIWLGNRQQGHRGGTGVPPAATPQR